jgi:hypothetical protein
MSDRPANATSRTITIDLTNEQLQRLDELRSDRNLSRGQLIGELLERAKIKRIRRPSDSGRQRPNPWAQPWPGGHV